MCASVNRNKNYRSGTSSRNSSRRSSIAGSARSVRSTRTDELGKLLGERSRPLIANSTGLLNDTKKELHPHAHHHAHPAVKPHMDHKKEHDKNQGGDKKALKKVKKPEGKGFFGKLVNKVKSLFC